MKTQVLTGSNAEIAATLAQIDGVIREVIVFVEEPADVRPPPTKPDEDIFAEMEPYMVNVEHFDDSREAIYTRMEGE